ncbi:hypothetical protein C1T31_08800 [Hanstruepera neustonica]|uniref:Uncharacterized protein n=1 Tax=Hanstruepera neustonica TaxID=1445657 RepID=A0A2K1DYG9_9FLAO|nr:DUF6134 family protein [Hanstruepera neustonica]PNQ73079.1 hypothetical protein C1T31_08800 [Hanstruepera neustonica]
MKTLLCLLLVSSVWIANSQTTTRNFEVLHDSRHLGTLHATKTVTGDQVVYTSHTEIAYQLMVNIEVTYDYDVTFVKGELQEAKAHITVRGNDKTKVNTVKKGSGYEFYSEGELVKTIKGSITHSIIQLLFDEPIGVTRIYAEEHGEYHELRELADHTYLKTAPSGKKNTYFYRNGELYKSDVNAGIIKFSIVKKD